MAHQLQLAQTQVLGLDAGHQSGQLALAFGPQAGLVGTVEIKHHHGGQFQTPGRLGWHRGLGRRCGAASGHHHRRRGRRGHHRRRGRWVAALGQHLRLGHQVFGDLHIGLGMAPALLGVFVAGVHQFDLGASGFLLGTAPAALAFEGLSQRPQIGPQALGAGHYQRGVHRQGRLANFHALGQTISLVQRLLRKGPPVIAGVLMQAHIQPALGLGQMVVAHRPAAVVEGLQPGLQGFVGHQVGVDRGVADAVGGRLELGGGCGGGCGGLGLQRRDRQARPQADERGKLALDFHGGTHSIRGPAPGPGCG